MEDNGNLDNNFRAADLLLLFQCKDSPAQGKLIIFVKNPKKFYGSVSTLELSWGRLVQIQSGTG
jgi:hypothetical protein